MAIWTDYIRSKMKEKAKPSAIAFMIFLVEKRHVPPSVTSIFSQLSDPFTLEIPHTFPRTNPTRPDGTSLDYG